MNEHDGTAQSAKQTQLRILIATDAWRPQVNGVVRTLETLCRELEFLGHQVCVIEPGQFRTIPCPTYPEIRLSLNAFKKTSKIIGDFSPTSIHIATEGPLGLAARRHCVKNGLAFTTSFHTRFPEYIYARTRIPLAWTYKFLSWFHGAATSMMVATHSLEEEMSARGFQNLRIWSRGVDLDQFFPRDGSPGLPYEKPVWLYVGRIAVEKNIKSFLELNLDGTKVLVGDGPQRNQLQNEYPQAKFVGVKHGEELALHYAGSDVFVFPSKTDTFGLVIIEALASGLPVAAYPVPGPNDIIATAPVGILDEDLESAARRALTEINPEACREHALDYSWAASAAQFLSNTTPVLPGHSKAHAETGK